MYQQEVQEMIALLREAAQQEILPRFGKAIPVAKGEEKGFKNVVTEADIKSSESILNRIRPKFPGSYSEEHKYEDRFSGYELIWQIDPVDGTDEFCHLMEDGFACHAALLKKQQNGTYFPVAGIIYLPAVDKLWYCDGRKGRNGRNETHFLSQGKPTAIPTSNHDHLRAWIRKVDPSDKLRQFYHHLGEKLGLPVQVIEGGGAGASISDLLEGKTNLIIMNYDYTKEWDLAMAEPIIRARGGFICDFDGNEFTYNRLDTPDKNEPYNLRGYIISFVFRKEDILPHINHDLLEKRL